jgi:hypothetical protein
LIVLAKGCRRLMHRPWYCAIDISPIWNPVAGVEGGFDPQAIDRLLSLAAHHLANETNDDHQDAPAYAAAHDLADYRPDIQSTSHIGTPRRPGRHAAAGQHRKQLAAETTADDARQAVPQRSEIELLQQSAYDVATRRPGYERDNKAYDSSAHLPDPLLTDNILSCWTRLRNTGV